MPCLAAILALFWPRFIIVVLVLTGDYIGRARRPLRPRPPGLRRPRPQTPGRLSQPGVTAFSSLTGGTYTYRGWTYFNACWQVIAGGR